MKRILAMMAFPLLLLTGAAAQEFNAPVTWRWLSDREAAFSEDGFRTEEGGFVVDARSKTRTEGLPVAALRPSPPAESPALDGAVNPTWSPDSAYVAYTRANDLYVYETATETVRRLTWDGSAVILNGYASWVYYEEIFGRPSRYRAFWWSPDGKTLAFYRFDDSAVPMFPIYSAAGQDGTLRQTRYPKAGECNPSVRIGFVEMAALTDSTAAPTVWADFPEDADQYFGTPFWSPDGRTFFVQWEPRAQNALDLYAVNPLDGQKRSVYHETYATWLDWIDGVLFTERGLYMVRSFETLWQQIYFLSYDGRECRRITSGENWRIRLLRADAAGNVYFTAERDSHVRSALYRADGRGGVTALTDPALHAGAVSFSPDGRYFVAALSNYTTPTQVWLCQTSRPLVRMKVADLRGPDYDETRYALPQLRRIMVGDGLEIPAAFVLPRDFDPMRQYPVHVDLYGGPDTPVVTDRWRMPTEADQWWSEQGIIEVIADCRASGHNGRAGLDAIYRRLGVLEAEDFVAWADYLKALPYVDRERIGVEGFSFGGTMTALLVMTHPEAFPYGIAGGGVYDWALYDTHYTERFMGTPQDNPEGYAASRVVSRAEDYPVTFSSEAPAAMLKLTHGTGDDNVHFQHTLQLVNALILGGKRFDLMIYPDGMHGYRGAQRDHSTAADRAFWLRYLKGDGRRE